MPTPARALAHFPSLLPFHMLFRKERKEGRERERKRSNSSTNQFASKGGFTVRSLGPFYHPFPSLSPFPFLPPPPLPLLLLLSLLFSLSTSPFRERIQSASKTPYNHPPSGIRHSTSRFSTPSPGSSSRRERTAYCSRNISNPFVECFQLCIIEMILAHTYIYVPHVVIVSGDTR